MTLWSELRTARPSRLGLASKHDDVMMLVMVMILIMMMLAVMMMLVVMVILRMLVVGLASKHDGDRGSMMMLMTTNS